MQRQCPRKILWAFLLFLSISAPVQGQTVQLKDHSDWWSVNNGGSRRGETAVGKESISAGSFEVMGVALGKGQFEKLAVKLGRAPVVRRGDASTGRSQVCYEGTEGPQEVYLVFEFGEDESVFYLFRDGAAWNGQNFCVKSKQISTTLATPSGLRLGLTPAQVEQILGKADTVQDEKFVYSREIRVKATPAEFDRMRKDYPERLSDKAAHEQFDFYSVDVYIEARFAKSALNYLAVSKSGGPGD